MTSWPSPWMAPLRSSRVSSVIPSRAGTLEPTLYIALYGCRWPQGVCKASGEMVAGGKRCPNVDLLLEYLGPLLEGHHLRLQRWDGILQFLERYNSSIGQSIQTQGSHKELFPFWGGLISGGDVSATNRHPPTCIHTHGHTRCLQTSNTQKQGSEQARPEVFWLWCGI